jgi:membrane protein implicated in regulation of membrane protease activity
VTERGGFALVIVAAGFCCAGHVLLALGLAGISLTALQFGLSAGLLALAAALIGFLAWRARRRPAPPATLHKQESARGRLL